MPLLLKGIGIRRAFANQREGACGQLNALASATACNERSFADDRTPGRNIIESSEIGKGVLVKHDLDPL